LYLSAPYVTPVSQHHGYGTDLLEQGIAQFKDQYDEIFLEVDNKNDEAMAFYKHKGFEVVRSYEHVMYGETMDLALMRKKL
ncbi:GNAT family N-acetyltransferase, partial [Staphylococcus arlettae]